MDRTRWLADHLRAEYRRRNVIETNYRVPKNEFRGRTTTHRGSYRFLLFLVGTLMRNLWAISQALADRAAAAKAAKEADGDAPGEEAAAPGVVRLTAKVWKDRVLEGQKATGRRAAAV